MAQSDSGLWEEWLLGSETGHPQPGRILRVGEVSPSENGLSAVLRGVKKTLVQLPFN